MSEVPKFEIEVRKGESQSSSAVMKDVFVIGRAPTCDVVIEHPQVSREHLRIEWKNEKLFVVDLSSSHGTSLNGNELTPHKAYHYTTKDELTLARKAATITINQISKPQTETIQIELSSPDFSVPHVPIPSQANAKITTTHFLGNTTKVPTQVNSSEQLKQLLQKRENEEQALKDLAENQKARREQLDQILAQLSTLDQKHSVEKNRLQEMLKDVAKIEQDIRDSRQHLDKVNTETKDLFAIKEQARNEIAALDKHKHNLSSIILTIDEEKITQQKKLQEVQEKIFSEQKQTLELTEKRTVFEALIDRLSNEQTALSQQCNELRLKNQQSNSETLKLQSEKQALQTDLDFLLQKLADSNKTLINNEKQISEFESLKKEGPELKLNIGRSREQFKKITDENRTLEQQKAELVLAKANIEAEVVRVQGQKDSGIRELEKINKQVESAQQTLKDFSYRANKLNDEMHQLDAETRKSTKAAADKLAELSKMERSLSDLRTQMISTKENVSKLQDERKSLDQYVTQIRTNAEGERKTLLANAEEAAKKLMEQKKVEAAQILKDAKNNARSAFDEIQKETLLKIHQSEEKANRVVVEAKEAAQKIIEAAREQKLNLDSEYESEKKEKRLALDQELVVMRLRETEVLRRSQSQEEEKWLAMKEAEVRTVKEILKAQLRLILREKLEGSSDNVVSVIANKVEETFIDVLDTEFLKKDDNSNGPVPIYNPADFQKEKLSWKQWSYKHRVALSVVFLAAVIPLAQKAIVSYHESSKVAEQKNFRDMIEQREIASRVEFESSEDYKNTFVDNMLYTTNFTETISDPDFKDELVKKLDVFINKELDLHEEIVPIFMGKETELVLNLLNIKEKIKQQNKDASLKAMKKLESDFNQVMLENLKTSDNARKFKRFLKDFYINYQENRRVPAGN
ncbi:MAG: FHA domain-containing protein [Pseudomonadota bacterium]|nr:FHA domain-containing protein [Pseudomonadota bacterium]